VTLYLVSAAIERTRYKYVSSTENVITSFVTLVIGTWKDKETPTLNTPVSICKCRGKCVVININR
jgi:hypothetical protein